MTPHAAPDFRLLFETAPGLYLVLAPDLTIVAASDAYLHFAGTEREKVIGRKISSVFPERAGNSVAGRAASIEASLRQVLSARAADAMALETHNVPRPESDGGGIEQRLFSLVNTPIFAVDGAIAWILHHVEDVTEAVRQRRARRDHEMFSELLEKTLELDRLKTSFLSNASQEYHTAVKSIVGLVENVRLRQDGTLAGEALRAVHFNSLRLLKLANSMMDFARIEGGRIDLALQPTNLAGMTGNLVESFRPLIEKAGLELIVDCPPLAEPVYVDRSIWEKIVVNLISNAFKFTFEGSIAVSMEHGADHVVVLFRDTGTGIAESELPHIFERFHRIPGARSRTYEGTGIGLALVHELVQQHGGAIDVWSEEERGTTFRVTLPTGWRPREEVEAFPSAETQPSTHESARSHILIVEDNASRRDYLTSLLSRHFRVTVAESGGGALAAVRRDRPDLIVSHVTMPVIDGPALVRNLRQDPETAAIPVILHSAGVDGDQEADSVTVVEAGADDYLGKSISGPELVARVRTHLEIARIQRAAADAARELSESRTALLKNSDARLLDRNSFWDPIAGEVREHLPHIAGLIEMIETLFSVSLDISDRRYLSRIRPTEMDKLIDDLLNFSRLIRAGMNKTEIHLGRLVEEVIEQIERDGGPPTVWNLGELPSIHADVEMMRAALIHLISNALKFSSRCSRRSIEIGVEKSSGDNVVFFVGDNGVGFDMDHACRLFGIFGRLHSQEDFEGAGIGLAIVRQIIEKHAGRTWAEGTAGKGAKFYCSLPIETEEKMESNA